MLEPHVALPPFEYIKPTSLKEACQFLAQHPGKSRPLSGGTDIFVRMRDGHWTDEYLVDIKGLDGTDDIKFDAKSGLRIGAAVNMNRLIGDPQVSEHYPLLVEACLTVASYQLRNRATLVGNICNASPAGDAIGACLVYEAVLNIQGTGGTRQVPLTDFFLGPGATVLQAGEIVTSIEFPLPPLDAVGAYSKLGRNQLGDLAIVGVAVLGYPDKGSDSGHRFRLALAAVAPTPIRSGSAESLLAQGPLDETSISSAAELAMESCSPITDVRGGAEYRKLMVRNLARRTITQVVEALK
jgi:carbon-monoxide dehydrogenase medium subunit